MKTFGRSLLSGGFGATTVRFISIVCCLIALALLLLTVRRAHTNQTPIEIGLILLGVSLASGQLQRALQDRSLPDHETDLFRPALWLQVIVTSIVTLLAVGVALLLLLPASSASAMTGRQHIAVYLVLAQALINGADMFVALLWNSVHMLFEHREG